jgi:hypothetical protein
MLILNTLLLALLLTLNLALPQTTLKPHATTAPDALKIETSYDAKEDKTTVRLAPTQISGENGKYHSLHMAPAFSYPGKEPRKPDIIDFELRSVVRGRLDTDLYVLFVIDGEKVFLSSSRWGLKRPVPGRVWRGERLVFRMPYETFQKIARARVFEIRFDGIKFPLGEEHLGVLRAFANRMELN